MDDGDPARCPIAIESDRRYKTHLFSALVGNGRVFLRFRRMLR